MSDEERLSKAVETLRNCKLDFDKTKVWSEGQPFTIEDLRKLIRQRPKPYEWYRRDLKRKRPHRKQGRNLYRGIQDYRQRVGQPVPSKKGLGFRGVARLYDYLHIKVLREHPEMASRYPDLYTRYMYLRFPPLEFRNKVMAGFATAQKPCLERSSSITTKSSPATDTFPYWRQCAMAILRETDK